MQENYEREKQKYSNDSDAKDSCVAKRKNRIE